MKRRLLLLGLILFSFQSSADISQTFTVEVERGDKTEFATEQLARGKILVNATERLPTLILGEERLRTVEGDVSSYEQQIKAILVGQADLQVAEKSWNEDRTLLSMTARVSLDYSGSMSKIAGVQADLRAQAAMAEAYEGFVDSVHDNAIKDFSLSEQLARVDRVILNHFNALGMERSLALQRHIEEHEATIASYDAYYSVFLPMWHSLSVEVVGVQPDQVVIDIHADQEYAVRVAKNQLLDVCVSRERFHRSHRHFNGNSLIQLPVRIIVSESVDGEVMPDSQYFSTWQNGRPLRFSPHAAKLYQEHASLGDKPSNGYRMTTTEIGVSLDSLVRSPAVVFNKIGLC